MIVLIYSEAATGQTKGVSMDWGRQMVAKPRFASIGLNGKTQLTKQLSTQTLHLQDLYKTLFQTFPPRHHAKARRTDSGSSGRMMLFVLSSLWPLP